MHRGFPAHWQTRSVLPALDRKAGAVGAACKAGDQVGRRLMVLSSLSTLLSDDPTARGLEIVLSSCSLQKQKASQGLIRIIFQACVLVLTNNIQSL